MFLSFLLQTIFWFSVLALGHSYVVYPFLVRVLAKGKEARSRKKGISGEEAGKSKEKPYIAVLMAAHNEEAVIGETLRSIFSTDYPRDRMEVLIAADNCSDRTVEIVEEFQRKHENITIRTFPGRNGKIRVVNRLFAENRDRLQERGDYVVIFCDANVRWSKALPNQLARPFRNPRIGMVAANVLDGRGEHLGIAGEEEAYINRENEIKHAEGVLWGRMMGAFGACYAMRGCLVDEVPEDFVVDDFFQTMRCFEQGYDAVVELKAVCYEDVSEDIGEEFRRKKRIAVGGYQNLRRFFRLLTVDGGPATIFAFWSHKGLRWTGPLWLIGAFLTSLVLAPGHLFFALALVGQIGLMTAACLDALFAPRGVNFKLLRFIRYFYLMNFALLLGGGRFLRGVKSSVWEPTRRVVVQPHAAPPASVFSQQKPRETDSPANVTPSSRP